MRIFGRTISAQFSIFCLVGTSSLMIDLSITNFLFFGTTIPAGISHPIHIILPLIPVPSIEAWVAKACGVSVASILGYILNSKMTFKQSKSVDGFGRFIRFILVIVAGMVMNATIVSVIVGLLGQVDKVLLLAIQFFGSILTAWWNFYAHKRWTYKLVS